jgi:hypothetical protein
MAVRMGMGERRCGMWRCVVAAVIVALGATTKGGEINGKEEAEPGQEEPAGWEWMWRPAVLQLLRGQFRWVCGEPLVGPADRADDPCQAIKDPSVVWYGGKWHLFCTIRSQKRTHQIEYLSFGDWKEADKAERHVLKITDGYFCAPQVFYFRPHRKWYLICQVSDKSRRPQLQPAYATNDEVSRPEGWSAPKLLFGKQPAGVRMWIDFWVICDERKAHLFFTSLDGQMWRSETALEDFPEGWSAPMQALRADIFEASHTYCLKGLRRYLTIVEAQDGGRRYYKAYVAGGLDGMWTPLADSTKKPFAAPGNVKQGERPWTDSFSHGELIRSGYDQKLEVDPLQLRFLFQGVSDEDKAGKNYGQIPWRLGILEAAPVLEKQG